jgi:phage-related minor tail protein
MAGTELPAIFQRIGLDSSDFEKGADSIGSKASAVGATVGKAFLGIGAVGLGAAGGLLALGGSFDDAFDKIRVQTGATGDDLVALKDTFKAVVRTSRRTLVRPPRRSRR